MAQILLEGRPVKIGRYNPENGEIIDEVDLTDDIVAEIDKNECTHRTTINCLLSGMTMHTSNYDYWCKDLP